MSNSIDQQIFDTCAVHLLEQRARSTEGGAESLRRYRGNGGMRCAIGCLIADRVYSPTLEGKTVQTEIVQAAIADSLGIKRDELNLDLLTELQEIHDLESPDTWHDWLARLAQMSKLTTTKMESIK